MRILTATMIAGAMMLGAMGASLAQGALPEGVKAAGGIFTNASGMTLYTFDNDKEPGKSACNGPCLTNWPAVTAAADAKASGDWTVITRDEGAKQWAYKGKPLYTFKNDAKAGDQVGDNRGNVWHTAKP